MVVKKGLIPADYLLELWPFINFSNTILQLFIDCMGDLFHTCTDDQTECGKVFCMKLVTELWPFLNFWMIILCQELLILHSLSSGFLSNLHRWWDVYMFVKKGFAAVLVFNKLFHSGLLDNQIWFYHISDVWLPLQSDILSNYLCISNHQLVSTLHSMCRKVNNSLFSLCQFQPDFVHFIVEIRKLNLV